MEGQSSPEMQAHNKMEFVDAKNMMTGLDTKIQAMQVKNQEQGFLHPNELYDLRNTQKAARINYVAILNNFGVEAPDPASNTKEQE
ncbi:MAG TPA: hypothetical protein VHQ20_00875 [Patescibacteria group bacterium]|jgi:hypothetical protein|nr:hypothetical protein [Patescibacteria group bacterium]